MSILAVIPARYEPVRFPGKPVADLGGRPLIQWVHEAARQCASFDDVVVATDSELIASRVRGFGGHAEMTRTDHPSGTDRVAEVVRRYPGVDVVVNVQGDQPFATPDMLTRLIEPYLTGETPSMVPASLVRLSIRATGATQTSLRSFAMCGGTHSTSRGA